MRDFLASAIAEKNAIAETTRRNRENAEKAVDGLRSDASCRWLAVAKIHGFNAGQSGRDITTAQDMLRDDLTEEAAVNMGRAAGGYSLTNLEEQIQREVALNYLLATSREHEFIMQKISEGYTAGVSEKDKDERTLHGTQ